MTSALWGARQEPPETSVLQLERLWHISAVRESGHEARGSQGLSTWEWVGMHEVAEMGIVLGDSTNQKFFASVSW